MIIVSSAVEANETELHKILNLSRSRINHSDNWFALSSKFPVDKEQIREYLDIYERKFCVFVWFTSRRLLRFELHLTRKL